MTKKISDIIKSEKTGLPYQVNPKKMKPEFEKYFSKLPFYFEKDTLDLWKEDKSTMNFEYSSYKNVWCSVTGKIYHRKPRKDLEHLDPISIMEVYNTNFIDEKYRDYLMKAISELSANNWIDMISEEKERKVYEKKKPIFYLGELKKSLGKR